MGYATLKETISRQWVTTFINQHTRDRLLMTVFLLLNYWEKSSKVVEYCSIQSSQTKDQSTWIRFLGNRGNFYLSKRATLADSYYVV